MLVLDRLHGEDRWRAIRPISRVNPLEVRVDPTYNPAGQFLPKREIPRNDFSRMKFEPMTG